VLESTFTATEAPGSDAPMALERPTTFGRYIMLERLGSGGMGVVYAAYDPDLDRKLAVKVMRPEVVADQSRLLREARTMARLQHPNVAVVHDVGTVAGQLFIAMELVDGTTLASWLQEKPRAWPEVLALFLQAGRGLAAARRRPRRASRRRRRRRRRRHRRHRRHRSRRARTRGSPVPARSWARRPI